MRRVRLLPLGMVALACTFPTTRDAPATNDVADAGERGMLGGSGAGGGSSGQGTAGAVGGTVDQAGAGGEPIEPANPSGTALCEDDRDCAGLVCMTMAGTSQNACVRHCSLTLPCAETETCVENPGITSSCLPGCEWPWDCTFGFDCFSPLNDGEYVCVPTEWARDW